MPATIRCPRRGNGLVLFSLVLLSLAEVASAQKSSNSPPSPLVVTMSFNPASIPVGGTSKLSFSVVNPGEATGPLTSVGFTDVLPEGLVIATPPNENGPCGWNGTHRHYPSTPAGGNTIETGIISLPPDSGCVFSVDVVGTVAGVYNNQITVKSDSTPVTASATLMVLPPNPPQVTMSFSPVSISAGGTSKLSFSVLNPEQATVTLTGMGFTDVLPAGLVIATPSNENGSCGWNGTHRHYPSTPAGGNTVETGIISLPPDSGCVFSVDVVGTVAGVYNNQITVKSDSTPVTASATLTVVPLNPPQVTMNFNPASIPVGGTSRLSFSVVNPEGATGTLTGVGFTDVLPAGLVIATPSNENGSCGWNGTHRHYPSTPAGGNTIETGIISLPPDSGCVFSVDVVGTVAGVYNNQITVKSDSTPVTASASLTAQGMTPVQGLPTDVPVQTTASRQTSTATLTATAPTYLDKCSCGDGQRLKDRLEKLKGAALLVANQLQSTPAGKGASQQQWNALQSQIKGYLRAMQIQNLTSFPDDSLFLGNDDPFCGPQKVDAGVCLNQDFALHQLGHDASWRGGNWTWQTSWVEKDMLLEEGNTIEKEMAVLKETINRLGCGTTKVCPQFGIVVQNVTTSSMNIPGALAGQSARSLNNGQGVSIPLAFHEDGSFEGFGSGSDSGSAMGATPNEAVGGQFGHSQSIAASGFIRPGSCNAQGCQDVMHLVLVGGPSSQMRDMHARGVVNRDITQPTQSGAATLEFDLPAYVGGAAQKTFFATAMLNSYMRVNLVQGNNGTSALPEGSSLLYSLQQCKIVGTQSGGSRGGAGIVIPGLEDASPTPTKKSTLEIPNKGGVGVIIPGFEGVAPSQANPPVQSKNGIGVVIPGLENTAIANSQPASTNTSSSTDSHLAVVVSESLKLSDATTNPAPHVIVGVHESLQISDTTALPAPRLSVHIDELLHASDTVSGPRAP